MRTTTKLFVTLTAAAGLVFPAVVQAQAQEANPTITITNEGGTYTFSPPQLDAKAGQAISITNKDANGVHNVTARDNSFSLDVPPQSTVTLTVKKAGNYPYYCQYHTDAHNPASLNIS
jgi:plastocyanin